MPSFILLNIHSFKLWAKMYHSNNFLEIALFDAVHSIYLEELRNWIDSLDYGKDGFINRKNTFYLVELFYFPLRTFDAIRRISYLCYVMILNGQSKEAEKYAQKIITIIENNESSENTPL